MTIVLTYIRINSTRLEIKLHKTLKQLLPTCGLRVILKISSRMKYNLNFKDKLRRELRSSSIYKFKCNSCDVEYIGNTKWHYRTQSLEHIGVSSLTGTIYKSTSQTSVAPDHLIFCKTVVCPKSFSILAKSTSNLKLEIQESILIKLIKPTLIKNISSVWLYLFW